MSDLATDTSGYGTLYVVSTPIGNLSDISLRAIEVLGQVSLIAAEDTRHSSHLLNHLGIRTKLMAYHDHSDAGAQQKLLDCLLKGQSIALISDAGTPLIADPGYKLVRAAREQVIRVIPVPGACALIAALSVAGLATDRFVFEGFLPAKAEARKKQLQRLATETRTLVFYESPHRLIDSIKAMADVLGTDREAVLARELTKRFETLLDGTLEKLVEVIEQDSNQQRGELVIIVAGLSKADNEQFLSEGAEHTLRILLEELSVKQAAALTAKLTGAKKNQMYELALQISSQDK